MSYDSKITLVKNLVDTHNSNVDDSSKIDFDQFMDKLRKMGGSSEEALKSCSWEDLQECGLPTILARTASKIFRQENGDSTTGSGWVSDKKAQQMTIRELIERYDPAESSTHVAQRLASICKKQKCIVFNKDGKVAVEASYRLVEDLKQGLPEVQTTIVEGIPTAVYAIGERPDQYFDENPLFPGRVLRTGQTCDQTNRSWEGIPTIVRQLLWLAVAETMELKIDGIPAAHDVLDKIVSKQWDESSIRFRFKQASLRHDRFSIEGRLPLLKISMFKTGTKKNDPFGTSTTF